MTNMKLKSFRSVPSAWIVPLACLCTALISTSVIYFAYMDEQLSPFVLFVSVLFLLGGITGAVFSSQQAMCSVVLYDDHLLCRIPFSKNVSIFYEKCYIGMDYHVQNGWKIWWIYLCYGKMPPYKNPHLGNRINSIKCQPGFIRIMYRDDVYEALMEALPKKQKVALASARRCSGFEKQGRII